MHAVTIPEDLAETVAAAIERTQEAWSDEADALSATLRLDGNTLRGDPRAVWWALSNALRRVAVRLATVTDGLRPAQVPEVVTLAAQATVLTMALDGLPERDDYS